MPDLIDDVLTTEAPVILTDEKPVVEEAPVKDQPSRLVITLADLFNLRPDTEGTAKYLHVPMAVLGSWKHEEYGTVEFTQETFDQIVLNFERKVAGYEPPLFLGHPTSYTSFGGEAAIGFLESIYQEGDVLYGLYAVVDEEAYGKIRKGQFRYASVEIINGAINKSTEEQVGTLLIGCAITNRPFVPNLPRVTTHEVFAESRALGSTEFMFQLSIEQPAEKAPMDESTQNTQMEQFAEQMQTLSQKTSDLETQLKDAMVRVELAEQRAATAEKLLNDRLEKERQELQQQRLEAIAALNIEAEYKEKYSEIVANGLPEEQFTPLYSMLKKLSDQNATVMTAQHGDNSNKVVANPYQVAIDRNHQLAEKRKATLQYV